MHSKDFQPRALCRGLLGVLLLLSGSTVLSQPALPPQGGLVTIPGHQPPTLAQTQVVRPVDGTEVVPLALALPLRNEALLEQTLTRIYDPNDPLYRHYLTPQQFLANFGPTQADYDALTTFARSQGLTITGTHANRLFLNVTGSAATVQKAFNVPLMHYRAANGNEFRAPSAEPKVPAAIASRLAGIVGLDNAAVWHPLQQPRLIGSGPGGGMSPSDIRAAYNLSGTTLNGSGQTLAVFELDGFTTSDITNYEKYFGLPNVTLQTVLVDNFSGRAGGGAGEVTLDIELQIALAPGASKILVYEGTNSNTGVIDTYNRIATDNIAKQVSTSWGIPEQWLTSAARNSENAIFQQMAAQGQTIYSAAGDAGAFDDGSTLSVDDPSSQPYMTGVGGTTLTTNGAGGAWKAETTWNGGSVNNGAGGGGISAVWTIPSYQMGLVSSASLGSTTMRNVPDVSLNADPNSGYAIYYRGRWNIYGGTSCAAPLWAAFTALVNQQRAAIGVAPLGFANPFLYQLGQSARGTVDFHDIADSSTNLNYPAVLGYDDATGWGSFNGANLLADLIAEGSAASISVASFTVSPDHIVGGYHPVGTVTLSGPAPVGGAVVTFSSSNRNASPIVASVTIPAGQTSLDFDVSTRIVTTPLTATLTARYNGSVSTTLTVVPKPSLVSFTVSPNTIVGGYDPIGTITLSQIAPPGGAIVPLQSSNRSAAPIVASVIVPEGQTSVSFDVSTKLVTSVSPVTLTAAYYVAVSTTLTVVPKPVITAFTISAQSVRGGQSITGTVRLSQPSPPGGSSALLSSSNSSVVPIGTSVVIPAGQTSVSFTINTNAVSTSTSVTLSAHYYNTISNTLTVTP